MSQISLNSAAEKFLVLFFGGFIGTLRLFFTSLLGCPCQIHLKKTTEKRRVGSKSSTVWEMSDDGDVGKSPGIQSC